MSEEEERRGKDGRYMLMRGKVATRMGRRRGKMPRRGETRQVGNGHLPRHRPHRSSPSHHTRLQHSTLHTGLGTFVSAHHASRSLSHRHNIPVLLLHTTAPCFAPTHERRGGVVYTNMGKMGCESVFATLGVLVLHGRCECEYMGVSACQRYHARSQCIG